jgi:hypothetical protein
LMYKDNQFRNFRIRNNHGLFALIINLFA